MQIRLPLFKQEVDNLLFLLLNKREKNRMNEIIKKITYYFEGKIIVHVETSNRFYNGLIIEIIGEDFIILHDRIIGDTPIYFSEIKLIEKFKDDGKR